MSKPEFTPIYLDLKYLTNGIGFSQAMKDQSKDLTNDSIRYARNLIRVISQMDNHEYAEADFVSCLREIVDLFTENLAMMAISIADSPEDCTPEDYLWCTVLGQVRESTVQYVELLGECDDSLSLCLVASNYVDAMSEWETGISDLEAEDE